MACSSSINSSSCWKGPTVEFSSEDYNHEKIYMATYWSNDKVGMAYYGIDRCVLYMMLDTQETMDTNVFKKAYLQIQPSEMLACSKDRDKLLCALRELKPDEENVEKSVHVLPSIDFSVAACKQRLSLMNLPNAPMNLTHSEKSIYISTLVQSDSSNMMKCVGALLHYLEKNRIGSELEQGCPQVSVTEFKLFNIQDFLSLDSFTYKSLQIFKEESHPAGLIANKREGFSLFSLLNKCKSKVGVNMMKQWFKHPLSNRQAIISRHSAVSFFLQFSNFEFANLLQGAIKNMRNTAPLMKRMSGSQFRHSDWKILYQTLLACLEVNELLLRVGYPSLNVFEQLKDLFATNEVGRLASYISSMVDFEETELNQRACVKPNISHELDMKKEIYDNLSMIMEEVHKKESLDPCLGESKVVYFPQIGYLLTVKATETMVATDNYSLPGKEYMFVANGIVYYKTEETKNLDRNYGDIKCDIVDIEAQYIDSLQSEVLSIKSLILNIVGCIAEIDCLLSFSTCARINNYIRPEMVEEPIIEISNGRHPLLEVVGTFIPNSTQSYYPGKVHVVTGANASGKSVYLKQIGLIVFMAQIGSFVPADSARLGIIDQLFTKMQIPGSISLQMSSFLTDINKLSIALKMATNRSLILLDEFGKGTQEEDGASLLAATINYLDRLDNRCPHSFISTHFHILNEARLLTPSPNIQYMKTMVMVEGEDRVTYFYQMEDGIADSSHGMEVAEAVGIPCHILKRARQVLQCMREGKPISPLTNNNMEIDLEKCQKLCDDFFTFDLEHGNIRQFIEEHGMLNNSK